MQITKARVIPIELQTRQPVRMAGMPEIKQITAIFVCLETKNGLVAWGVSVAHPELTGEDPKKVIEICQEAADFAPDLHPTNIEYSLSQLGPIVKKSAAAMCAFDLVFHDLLGLAASMPLYKLLGGYRNRIQTSATIPLLPLYESVEIAKARAKHGFRMLKIKGGIDPDEDIERVKAIHRVLPDHILRLDLDGGYSVQQALDIARILEGRIEMLEQPTPAGDLDGLRQVTRHSTIPILADQSVKGPESALILAADRIVDGLSIKIANCGGLRCARQMDSVARMAHLSTMVSCLIEPALLIAAGLSFALSSPNVCYGDLDGHLDLITDPSLPGFQLEQGWFIVNDVPGLGCAVEF